MCVSARNRFRVLAFVIAAMLGGIVLTIIEPASSAYADPPCMTNGGVYIVFVRDSGEVFDDKQATAFHQDVVAVLNEPPRVVKTAWSEAGNEDGVPNVDMDQPPGNYVSVLPDDSNEYPAVPVDNWNAVNLANGNYGSSVNKGTDEFIAHLNDRVSRCPQESIVLAGYSQGADVVGWALQRTGYGSLNQTTRNHIGYVALYGDPKFDPGSLHQKLFKAQDPGYQLRTICTGFGTGL